jgi:hypothetical protein
MKLSDKGVGFTMHVHILLASMSASPQKRNCFPRNIYPAIVKSSSPERPHSNCRGSNVCQLISGGICTKRRSKLGAYGHQMIMAVAIKQAMSSAALMPACSSQ